MPTVLGYSCPPYVCLLKTTFPHLTVKAKGPGQHSQPRNKSFLVSLGAWECGGHTAFEGSCRRPPHSLQPIYVSPLQEVSMFRVVSHGLPLYHNLNISYPGLEHTLSCCREPKNSP